MDAADLHITADHVQWTPGHLDATGNVTVDYGERHLVAARATWDGARVIHLEDATLTQADGSLSFVAGEVWLDEGGDFLTVTARVGDTTLRAARVTVGETWTFTDAQVELCACADGKPPALSFGAKSGTLLPGRYVVLHGGTVRVFDVPVVPVPYWREPVNPKRFRLLLPEVGYGTPGWSAGLQATGGVGDWRFTGGPAWRQDRGFRAGLTISGPVDATGQIGWDTETTSFRGAGSTEAGFVTPIRAAWSVTGQTDPTYADDYGLSWVQRGVAWRDSRFVVGGAGAQLRGWIGDDGSDGTLLMARYRPVFGRSAWVAPYAAAALEGPTTLGVVGLGGVEAGASGTAGPVHGEAQLTSMIRTDTAWTVETVARAELPLWTDLRPGRLRIWPGVVAEVETAGTFDSAAFTLGAGPSLRAQLTRGSVVAGGSADLLVLPDGLTPRGTFDLSSGAVRLWATADPTIQAGGLGWQAPLSGTLGIAHHDALFLSFASTEAHIGRLLLGAGAAVDLDAQTWSSLSAKLGYDDGCSMLALTGTLSPDRDLPDLGLQLVLRK